MYNSNSNELEKYKQIGCANLFYTYKQCIRNVTNKNKCKKYLKNYIQVCIINKNGNK